MSKISAEQDCQGSQNLEKVVRKMQEDNDWAAFESFLDMVFQNAPEPVTTAGSIEIYLDHKWRDKFFEYCRNEPKLAKYVYEKDRQAAEKLVEQQEYEKAAIIYKDIIERDSTSSEQKTDSEFRICQCLFNSGNYNTAVLNLDSFLERNKANHRTLAKEALLLKGRCYIQQGELDKAVSTLSTIVIEYPGAKESPEASFFIGYSYMLQGKFQDAKEIFDLVIKDYPSSSYASKAKLCVGRIENMVE